MKGIEEMDTMKTAPPYSGKKLISNRRRSANADMPWFKDKSDVDELREEIARLRAELEAVKAVITSSQRC